MPDVRSNRLDQQVRTELRRLLKEKNLSERQVSLKLGFRSNWMNRKLSATRPLTISELESIVTAVGEAPSIFLRRVEDALGPAFENTPGQIGTPPLEFPSTEIAKLVRATGSGSLRRDERRILERVLVKGSDLLDCSGAAHHPKFSALIELAEQDSEHAFLSAQSLAYETVQARDSLGISNHASILTAWAFAAVLRGRISFASELAAHTLELHSRATLAPTYPAALRTASTVCFESGNKKLSLILVQHALIFSCITEDRETVTRTSLSLAALYTAFSYSSKALFILEALAREPPTSLEFKIHYNTAFLHLHEGRTRQARDCLYKIQPGTQLESLHQLWVNARILAAEGLFEDAIDGFEQVLAESKAKGLLQPADRLILVLQASNALEGVGDTTVLARFAAAVHDDLEVLEQNEFHDRLRVDVIEFFTKNGILGKRGDAARRPWVGYG